MRSVRPTEARSVLPEGEQRLQHGRYKLEQALGEGGMAVVYEAIDLSTGRKVALKRLRAGHGNKQAALAALFEREYLALSQLKHPRIVEVYDYHLDEQGPYYTMELLEGGDLQRLAPIDHASACALAHDVCSALALVHSRRMIYRDLSPSNVRRTGDGLGKLIDFGALLPMGKSRAIVGTLPCVAPEAIGYGALDARTDLFALGATLYFALTRRHAYPARNVEDLVEVWKTPPTRPSELVPGIPAALDQLVLELLDLDPERRPSSAGEVMERLAAITGLAPSEQLRVKQAYLATPALVGRDENLELVRSHALRAREGRGSSLCLQGPPAIGRSRMLEASGLEAKRLGILVLRAEAQDAQEGDYGIVRSLVRGLLTQAPKLARRLLTPHLGALARVIPELASDASEPPAHASEPQDVADVHRLAQPALRQWFCEVAAECPLLLVVDDLERSDARSAAFIGLLAREVPRHPILIVTAQTSGVALGTALEAALDVYARFSTLVPLSPLTLALTQSLLGSLFGEVPHLPLVAQHVQRITKGSPGDVLRLAEHLVSEDIIRYGAGTWTLPAQLAAGDLPSTMADALARRVARLSEPARRLCYGLSCEPAWALHFDECARILSEANAGVALKCLNELVTAEFIECTGSAYSVSHSTLGTALGAQISAEARALIHRKFAAICSERHDKFRCAQQLFRAEESEQGLSVLYDFVVDSVKQTDANPDAYRELLRTLPSDWLGTFDLGFALCERLGRPAREKRALLVRLSSVLGQSGPRLDAFRHARTLLDDLCRDVGLDYFYELPATEDPATSMRTALGRATVRYQNCPEHERVIDPVGALGELTKAVVAGSGMIAGSSSYTDWQQMPSLAPLSALSPAFALLHTMVRVIGLRIGGRSEEAVASYKKLLDRLAQPDRVGLPASHHTHTLLRIMGAVGALEAAMGRGSSLDWASKLAGDPRYESTELVIRQLYQLFQGDLRAAKRTKQELELLRLESSALQENDAQHRFFELAGHALAQDMTGVKRALEALAPYEELHVGFRAAAHYGRGEYHRMRGDSEAARAELEQALGLMRVGEHLLWANAASAHVRALLAEDQVERACELGQQYLQEASILGYLQSGVRAALALALSRAGDHEAAAQMAEQGITDLQSLGCSGLNLAVVCEARAQVAAAAGDKAAFERYSALFSAQWPAGNPHARGIPQAQAQAGVPDALDASERAEQEALSELKSCWETCHTVMERVHAGLEVLARHVGALGGVLFVRSEQGLVQTACYGESAKDAGLHAWATDYFTREITQYVTEDLEQPSSPPPSNPPRSSAQGLAECAPVLLAHSDQQGYALTGVVILVGSSKSRPPVATSLAAELSRCISGLDHVVSAYL